MPEMQPWTVLCILFLSLSKGQREKIRARYTSGWIKKKKKNSCLLTKKLFRCKTLGRNNMIFKRGKINGIITRKTSSTLLVTARFLWKRKKRSVLCADSILKFCRVPDDLYGASWFFFLLSQFKPSTHSSVAVLFLYYHCSSLSSSP